MAIPFPQRKTPKDDDPRALQILSVFADAINHLMKGVIPMDIHSLTSPRNKILGCISGAALPLAQSHHDNTRLKYLVTPTVAKYRKFSEARQRLNHVLFLLSNSGDEE